MLINNISCVQLMAQPMTFQLNNPPTLPNIPSNMLPPQVQQWVVPITAAVANKLSVNVSGQSGQPHPGRIFAFNMAAQNQYNNPFFGQLVASALDVLFWLINRNPQANIDSLLQQAADNAVSAEISRLIVQLPQLQSMLDQQIIMEARGLMDNFGRVMMEIVNMKNRAMGSYATPAHVAYAGAGPGGYHAGQQVQPYVHPHSNNPGMLSTGMGGSSNPLFSGSQPAQTTTTVVAANHGRTTIPYLQEHQQRKQSQQQQVYQPVVVDVPAQLTDWAPSNLQAYPPAYHESSQKAVVEGGTDPIAGKACYVIKIIDKDEQEMDRAQHKLSAPHRNHQNAINTNLSRAGVDFDSQLGTGLTESVTTASKELPDFESVRNILTTASSTPNKFGMATSMSEAVFSAQLKLQQTFKNDILFKAFTNFTILNKAHVSTHSYRAILQEISECDTYADAAKVITKHLNSAPRDAALAQFIENLDEFLVDEFNNFLATRLALIDIKIDNFITDAPIIIDHIRKTRGDAYADSLSNTQYDFIQSTIFSRLTTEENHEFLTEAVVPEEIEQIEETDVVANVDLITHIPQVISVTAVGVKAVDLDIGHLAGCGNMITSESFPALSKFARGLIRTASNVNAKVAHHYLVTMDKVVFEINEGIVGIGNTILISRKN